MLLTFALVAALAAPADSVSGTWVLKGDVAGNPLNTTCTLVVAAAKITDIDKTALMAQIDSNLASCFLCCRAAVKAMLPAGSGRIVNVAARPALEPRSGAGMTAYTVAKAGVAALTMALAEEVAKDGILVNAVAPSIMDTAANRKAMPKADHAAWPKVDEVAATIVFLASPDNRVTRGAVVPVYGKS